MGRRSASSQPGLSNDPMLRPGVVERLRAIARERTEPIDGSPDGFACEPDSPLAEFHRVLDNLFSGSHSTWVTPRQPGPARALFEHPDARAVFLACLERSAWIHFARQRTPSILREHPGQYSSALSQIERTLARRNLRLTDDDLEVIAEMLHSMDEQTNFSFPTDSIISQCRYITRTRPLPIAMEEAFVYAFELELRQKYSSALETPELGGVLANSRMRRNEAASQDNQPPSADRVERAARVLFDGLVGRDTLRARATKPDRSLLTFVDAAPPVQRRLLHELMLVIGHIGDKRDPRPSWPCDTSETTDKCAEFAASCLVHSDLPLPDDELCHVVEQLARRKQIYLRTTLGVKDLIRRLARLVDARPVYDRAQRASLGLAKRIDESGSPEDRRTARRLHDVSGSSPTLPLQPGEAWSDCAIELINRVSNGAVRDGWIGLLSLCAGSSASAPSERWKRKSLAFVDDIGGPDELTRHLVEWFSLVDKLRTDTRDENEDWEDWDRFWITDANLDILKGLCWIAGTIESPDLARALGRLAISTYRKVPGVGPRAVKVGNAAVYALGRMPGEAALGQLAMLRVRIKFATAQKLIEKALAAKAERMGMPREEIDELGVPSYGLTDVGVRSEAMGDHTAELRVERSGACTLAFRTPDGKARKSVPAAVKATHADDLKQLKAAAKDIASMLPAQRNRIDALFLENKSWDAAAWRERYLDHPLVGVVARRLIWRFAPARDGAWDSAAKARSALWFEGTLVGPDGAPVEIDTDGTRVRLWHPIEAGTDETLAWRRFLEEREIVQPFKQAHREVYILTDAERATETYSNRYAAHILRQHQFNALCAARNWRNTLRLLVDDEFPPASRTIRAHGLRAEFWVEGVGGGYGEDTNEAGVFHHVTTDQVRFYPIEAAENLAHASGGAYSSGREHDATQPVPLREIPPLVFSEVMRDVDLFVGVTSVGNNPAWQDGGPEGRFRDYWWSYSFGELTASAESRRDIIGRLLPRLRIAPVCELDGRFLKVRGTLRTYKVHLGSGNILMEPNDQYLCIVPGRGDPSLPQKLYLPFEGDRTLSVILSKAFMLAADNEIKDTTITRQIAGL